MGSTINVFSVLQTQGDVNNESTFIGILGPPPPPCTHWNPRLLLRWSADDDAYPYHVGPPVLYTTLPQGQPVHYALYTGQRQTATRHHAPEFYSDALSLSPISSSFVYYSLPGPSLLIEWQPTERAFANVEDY